jgi:hypothetical protein
LAVAVGRASELGVREFVIPTAGMPEGHWRPMPLGRV